MQDIHSNDTASHLVRELLKEKRSNRRWKTFRSLAWLTFFTVMFLHFFSNMNGHFISSAAKNDKYVALVRLDGMIASGRSFSAEEVVPVLRKAFADKNAAGVMIDINSPGGTPVQSSIIHDAILAYKKEFKKKTVVVGEDMLTSGAYFVAVAADKIYVNPSTLTGSVGVIMKGFGFVDLLKKFGVERRVYEDGSQKDRLDPFLPQKADDVEKIHQVMGEVRDNFADAVMEGRKGKIKGDPEKLFNGDFWTGRTALKLGLVDHLGNLRDASEKEFKTTTFKVYGDNNNFLKVLSGQLSSAFDAVTFSYPSSP